METYGWPILLSILGGLILLFLVGLVVFAFSLRRRKRIVIHRWTSPPAAATNPVASDPTALLAERRNFERQLDLEWRRALRMMAPISLAMIDIDHFGLFNEKYGRDQGDECLQIIGDLLQRQVFRAGDAAFRVTGEEFFLILPQTEVEGALKVMERFQAMLWEKALPHQSSPTSDRVTVSVGLATMVPDADSAPELLISEADRALYYAKKKGRNCVVCGPCH